MDMQAFFRIHSNLEREGPGDRASLDRALTGVRPDAVICDAGCGPGADIAGLLAHVPQGRVHAVDLHPPFIDRVRARFAAEPRVCAEVADFTRSGGRYDLIWSAGAAYDPGLDSALPAFRAALEPGGWLAFSHLCWRDTRRPGPAVAFWAGEYPAMAGIPEAEAQIARAGFRLRDRFWLSAAAWDAYYGPLAKRLDALEPAAETDAALADAIAAHRREIAIWRVHGESYGYALFVVAP